MATPTPRQRSSGGGFSLIMIGIVLALATAVLVLFLTNNGGAALSGGPTVVVAARTLPTGTVLSATNDSAPYMAVGVAFKLERMPASVVPADAYVFTSQDALASALNGQIITESFFTGDILRHADARLSALGPGPATSLVNHNPAALDPGDVLFALHTGNDEGMQVGAQEGDHVDVLATLCVNPNARGGCQVTQTTLQNLLIYAIPTANTLMVVVSHQDALVLKLLVETARIDLVLRKPGDTTDASTQAVDPAWIMSHFGYVAPGS